MASPPSSQTVPDATPPPPPSPTSPPPPSSSSPPPPSSSPPPPSSSPPPPTTSSSPPPPPISSSSPPPPTAGGTPPPPGVTPVFPPPPPHGNPVFSPPPAPLKPRTEPNKGGSGSGSGSPSTHRHSVSNTDAAIIGGAVIVLGLMFICLLCMRRKDRRKYSLEQGGPPPKGPTRRKDPSYVGNTTSDSSTNYLGPNPVYMQPISSPNVGGYGSKSPFTYDELASATSGFSQTNLLGQGGFGYVYKGILPNGKEVAIKTLKSGSGQGEREFQAEVEIISRVHHRYLVSLVGYCIAGEQRMLVYEFVANNTLEFHLHATGRPVMDWPSRLRIAVGSAKGLAYLHEDCHPRIIHRDIKSANILLESNFEAKVADFGLAKLSSDNFTHVSTRVMGTFGYLAPEYAASGKLTDKSDVFSFGVMLLEIITGRRPVDPTSKTMDSLSLVDWARPLAAKALESGDYSGMVDRRLEDNYVPHELARMIACAAACIRHSARSRPRMSQIVRALEGDASLEDLNESVKGSQSQVSQPFNQKGGNVLTYDTGAYNADMMKFRKMVLTSQEFDTKEYGTTSEYGHSSASSGDSGEAEVAGARKQKQ